MTEKRQGLGCTLTLLGINVVIIGLIAAGFATGSYSSWEQELWYRYGSLGFLMVGVILPAVALTFGPRRSPVMVIGLTGIMLVALMGCLIYATVSGGGI
jgi:hypothetical protein